MLTLSSKKDEEFILGAVENWEESGVSPTLLLMVGEEDYSDRIPTGDAAQDGIAITLEATFAGNLPLHLYGAPTTLSIAIAGVVVPMMQGLIALPESNDDKASTKLMAASTGSLADKYPLNTLVEYPGVSPDYVVRDALRRLPYPPGSVRVEGVDGPPLVCARGSNPGPFQADQKVSDILAAVEEKALYTYRDTAWGGHRAHVSGGLARVPEVPTHMRFREGDLLSWKSPSLTLEQVARVIVWKDNADGSPAFDPADATVTYVGRKYAPPAGLTLRIPFTGADPEEAWQLAYDKVAELRRGLFKNEPIIPFYPLIERTDVFTVAEVKDEDGTFYERDWLHYVDGWEQDWSLEGGSSGGFQTKTTCSVTLLDEQTIKAPTLNLGLISGGVISTPGLPMGSDVSGFWFDAETAISTTGQPWVGVDASGGWMDEEAAEGKAGIYLSGDILGFWFDF